MVDHPASMRESSTVAPSAEFTDQRGLLRVPTNVGGSPDSEWGSSENRDHELWDFLEDLHERFGVVAMSRTGFIEGGIAAPLGAALALAVKPDKPYYRQMRRLAVPVAFAGAVMRILSQYLPVHHRREAVDLRDIRQLWTKNQIEAKEIWDVHHFLRLPFDEQYDRSSNDPQLRDYLVGLSACYTRIRSSPRRPFGRLHWPNSLAFGAATSVSSRD